MYTGFHHLHSSLRYLILIVLIAALFRAWSGWKGNKPYQKTDNLLSLMAMILLHTQLLIGAVLYAISPKVQLLNMAETMKDPLLRFFTIEHNTIMIIAIALITIGRSLSKRASTDILKHKKIAVFFLIGALLIFIAIPWPFLKSFGSWF